MLVKNSARLVPTTLIVPLVTLMAVFGSAVAAPASATPAGTERAAIDLGRGMRLVAVEPAAAMTEGVGSFDGDTFDFQHQIGALIDDIFQCFSVHMSGMGDNTVLFDGFSELLDPYLDGTQPLIFEFETSSLASVARGPVADVFMNSFSDGGEDLFPEGFEDPETNTPLTDACIEIGIDDTLDADLPVDVTMATIEASGDSGTIIPTSDITSFFSSPWDGRLSLVAEGFAGQGINGMVLEMQLAPASPSIFADGFESGDTSAWTDEVP